MARRRRHRRLGDPVIAVPSFGDFQKMNPFTGSIAGKDVAIGAGIGIVGGAVVKYVLNMVWAPASQPQILKDYIQPISSIGAGVAAGMFLAKKSPQVAKGYLAGAVVAGLTPAIFNFLKTSYPTYFADPFIATQSYGSFLTRIPRPYAGLLTRLPARTGMVPARVPPMHIEY